MLYLLGYHILFAMFLWASWQTTFTEIGRVPSEFKMPREELDKLEQCESEEAQRQILERFAHGLPLTTRTAAGAIRYCPKCQHVKPDRAHHCRACGVCVLKMDHHCHWVNNCIAFTNYKFYILSLGYALLYCLFIAFTTLPYFISCWKGELQGFARFHVLLLFLGAVICAVVLVRLFLYHCCLVLRNSSTVEALRAPIFCTGADKDGFSSGEYNNFQEVFGDNMKTWFLPVFTSLGDGLVFPVRAQHQPSSNNSVGSTQTSATGMPLNNESVKKSRKRRRRRK
jgi:palmitoyltransferase